MNITPGCYAILVRLPGHAAKYNGLEVEVTRRVEHGDVVGYTSTGAKVHFRDSPARPEPTWLCFGAIGGKIPGRAVVRERNLLRIDGLTEGTQELVASKPQGLPAP